MLHSSDIASPETRPAPYQRDRFTWVAYGALGYYSYMAVILGPAMPFLRAEHNLNYTEGSLHVSLFALGVVISGLLADRFARWFGRRLNFWGGALGMGLGAILLITTEPTILTLSGTFLMGLGGGLLLVTIQASLSDRHGDKRAVALTESNVIASLCAILAPLLIGGFQSIGLGWRSAIGLGVGLIVLAFVFFRREPIPEKLTLTLNEENSPLLNKLPLVFWFYWAAIFFGVCCEICISFWSTDYLKTNGGLSETSAASFISLFFIAMAIGRIGGSYLVRHFESSLLLLIAIAIAGVGFPVFWLVADPTLKIAGLFVLGLGIANFFPLGLAAATGAAPRQAGMVSSRIALGAGAGVLGAPLALGWIADRVGLTIAFGIFPVFLVLVLTVILAARSSER